MRTLSLICGIALALAFGAERAEAQAKSKNRIVDTPKAQNKRNQIKGGSPTEQVERLLNMSPEEREKALAGLPPARRAAIEKRIDTLESLPPEVRERRINLAKRLESLPEDRQPVVRQEIQGIQRMPVPERRIRLHSSDFNQDYSPEEQQLIRDHFPNAARPR